MPNTYHHLSSEERAAIMLARHENRSMRTIAKQLGRAVSTISREIRRCGASEYDATQAGIGYRQRRAQCVRQPVLAQGTPLYQYVYDRLVYSRCSPQQIAHRLRTMPAEHCPGLVSHETIYATIYAQPRGALKQGMIQSLRQAKARRGRRRTTAAARSFVPEAQSIAHRPQDIDLRLMPGHWEGDFIKGGLQPLGGRRPGRTQDPVCCAVQDGRLHGRRCAGWFYAPDEETSCFFASKHELRPWQ